MYISWYSVKQNFDNKINGPLRIVFISLKARVDCFPSAILELVLAERNSEKNIPRL